MNDWIYNLFLALLLVIFVGLLVMIFRLRRMEHALSEAWQDIELQRRHRHQLVPKLIELVREPMSAKLDLLENAIRLRNKGVNLQGRASEQDKNAMMLSAAVKTILAVADQLSDLKANHAFIELEKIIVDTEERWSAARRFYNVRVQDYNHKIHHPLYHPLAKLVRFQPEEELPNL